MIESTKKKKRSQLIESTQKKLPNRRKKKKTILLPSNRVFFCLTAHLICLFFSVEFFGHNCKQLFFLSINCCDLTICFETSLIWHPIDCAEKKRNNSLSHCKRSCRRIQPKKENNTAALNCYCPQLRKKKTLAINFNNSKKSICFDLSVSFETSSICPPNWLFWVKTLFAYCRFLPLSECQISTVSITAKTFWTANDKCFLLPLCFVG